MKRTREFIETLDLSNSLMLLSHKFDTNMTKKNTLFECKTCNRQFTSFQALGGHRASHKRPRINEEDSKDRSHHFGRDGKPKMHECFICGLEFAMGQALGGHMKRHRVTMSSERLISSIPMVQKLPVLKRSNSKRVMCLLDLNLTPLENDLKLLFGKTAPKVDPFI